MNESYQQAIQFVEIHVYNHDQVLELVEEQLLTKYDHFQEILHSNHRIILPFLHNKKFSKHLDQQLVQSLFEVKAYLLELLQPKANEELTEKRN